VLLPMTLLMGLSLQMLFDQRQVNRAEQQGATVVERLLPLTLEVQKHRGLNERVLRGDKAADNQRSEARTALKAAIERLDAELSQPMDYPLDDAWQPLRTQLLELAAGRGVTSRHPPTRCTPRRWKPSASWGCSMATAPAWCWTRWRTATTWATC
jgi:hypothetical protein